MVCCNLSIDEVHAGSRPRDKDAGENFLRCQSGREDIEEEVPSRHLSQAIRACDPDLCLQRYHNRGPVSRWIGVRERAADRAAVTYLGIGNEGRRLTKYRQLVVQRPGSQEFCVRRQCADPDAGLADFDSLELGNAADVDQ